MAMIEVQALNLSFGQGADAVLVGEALGRTGDPRGGAAAMVAAGAITDREAEQ